MRRFLAASSVNTMKKYEFVFKWARKRRNILNRVIPKCEA